MCFEAKTGKGRGGWAFARSAINLMGLLVVPLTMFCEQDMRGNNSKT